MTPQHLQQCDTYHEALLHARVHALCKYDWGITDVQFDERSLSSGQLKLNKCHGVFPDGTPFLIGEDGEDHAESRSIEGNFPAAVDALDVYLAIPNVRESQANTALDPAKAGPADENPVRARVSSNAASRRRIMIPFFSSLVHCDHATADVAKQRPWTLNAAIGREPACAPVRPTSQDQPAPHAGRRLLVDYALTYPENAFVETGLLHGQIRSHCQNPIRSLRPRRQRHLLFPQRQPRRDVDGQADRLDLERQA